MTITITYPNVFSTQFKDTHSNIPLSLSLFLSDTVSSVIASLDLIHYKKERRLDFSPKKQRNNWNKDNRSNTSNEDDDDNNNKNRKESKIRELTGRVKLLLRLVLIRIQQQSKNVCFFLFVLNHAIYGSKSIHHSAEKNVIFRSMLNNPFHNTNNNIHNHNHHHHRLQI